MENIYFVPWPVPYAARLCVLAVKNIFLELFQIDPVLSLNHVNAGQDPPTVAHVWQLFRPAIEPARESLSSTQPKPKLILVN